ncbi:hypothetical protein [Helicobacter sp. MIT 05-5294]|uniref:hypothetical protein n=1 Tax=Helicobacter sp. MIT 05-5294 TaxID=1548150 RepID=UPI00051FF0F8|nr:hypothetical protein [Helicobacter sp. MIT 05-5294]TLD84799.1 hypothetical protein LS69_009835 [Helicobacter sp. MIT 05-5294]
MKKAILVAILIGINSAFGEMLGESFYENTDNIMRFLDYVHNRVCWTSPKTINYIYMSFECLEIYDSRDCQTKIEHIVEGGCCSTALIVGKYSNLALKFQGIHKAHI